MKIKQNKSFCSKIQSRHLFVFFRIRGSSRWSVVHVKMTVDRSSSKDDGQNGGRQSILIGGGSQLKHIHATDRKWPSGSDLVRRSRVIISPAVPLLKCKSLLGHYCRQYLESVMLFSYLQENFITKATYKSYIKPVQCRDWFVLSTFGGLDTTVVAKFFRLSWRPPAYRMTWVAH